ncbi:vacuolar protein sorting 8 [Aphomia sociella]
MDLLKTPSVQSLLDSDLESVESLQYLDIEELDEVEYALPASEAPTLAEILSANEEEKHKQPFKQTEEPYTCSALQLDFLQAVSQQLIQAQERSSAGAVTTISVGKDGKLTVGTAHGHLISFYEQTLRWVCDTNADRGAVSCLSYNNDSTRLLTGYARGLICQYESVRGILLRKLTLGGETWGILRVTWAGASGLALDTGGSVWLMKFSRPLGVRSARTSCLFSGARGEVVAMTARDARILALATLSRVIIVAGGRAAGIRLGGPPDTLPVLEWSETDDRVLVCARSTTLQWLSVSVTGSSISLRLMQRVQLKSTPLWLGWLGGSLAIFDSDENLRLWGEDYDKALDLSDVEPVYASAFFKGLWTDGRVSRAMCTAGVSALGGACVLEGALSLLGRKGIVRVRPRDILTRAQAFLASGHHLQALRLLCSAEGQAAKQLAIQFIQNISERPHVLSNKRIADQTIKICLKFGLNDELWNNLWEQCSSENAFVEALGDAVVRDELTSAAPSPDSTQALIERLAEFEPGLVERVVASLPLTSLDPHRASVFTREKGLWRGVGAIAAALGGSSGAMRSLVQFVRADCPASGGGACACAGAALLVTAADALAGRAAGGRALPPHAQPSARHDALHALLTDEEQAPLRVLTRHDAAATVRLLEQSTREPPFAGPLAKQNRLRVARALLSYTPELQNTDARTEILEFITNQLSTGALPPDPEVIKGAQELAATCSGERGDRAFLALLLRTRPQHDQLAEQRDAVRGRPRVLWRLDALLDRHDDALREFSLIEAPSALDTDEFFEYLRSRIEASGDQNWFESFPPAERRALLRSLVELRPRAAAALVNEADSDSIVAVLSAARNERSLEFGERLIETGLLRGDVAAAHLRNLCIMRPDSVKTFLSSNSGIVRPEEALAIVKELKVEAAEAVCLEATGDPSGALDAILRLMSLSENEESTVQLMTEAGELCARAAAGAPPSSAAALWTRLLQCSSAAPPAALLLEAAAHLPVEALLRDARQSPQLALTMLSCAAGRRGNWTAAARVAAREAHEALARALAAARRGLPVRGRCCRCGGRLVAGPPVRTAHCARAVHASCEPETSCGVCGKRLPDDVLAFPPRPARRPSSPPQGHDLNLVAPTRPDLEGVV